MSATHPIGPIVQPFDFAEARAAMNDASANQLRAEQARVGATRAFAEAERKYRMALAKQIVREHAGGAAWTVAQDLARGDKAVAQLRFDRDVAEGVKEAAEQAAWRHTADRRDLTRLIEWSMRVAPLGQMPEPLARDLPEGGWWT